MAFKKVAEMTPQEYDEALDAASLEVIEERVREGTDLIPWDEFIEEMGD